MLQRIPFDESKIEFLSCNGSIIPLTGQQVNGPALAKSRYFAKLGILNDGDYQPILCRQFDFMQSTPHPDFFKEIEKIFPPDRFLTDRASIGPYESDGLTAFRCRPAGVVLPTTQEEVVAAVKACHQFGVPFMARGSGTSLSGGSVPIENGLVIALNRLKRVVRYEPDQRIIVVEPGVINTQVSQIAAADGLYYAPDPSSGPVCTIGGNVAFNSGGAPGSK